MKKCLKHVERFIWRTDTLLQPNNGDSKIGQMILIILTHRADCSVSEYTSTHLHRQVYQNNRNERGNWRGKVFVVLAALPKRAISSHKRSCSCYCFNCSTSPPPLSHLSFREPSSDQMVRMRQMGSYIWDDGKFSRAWRSDERLL